MEMTRAPSRARDISRSPAMTTPCLRARVPACPRHRLLALSHAGDTARGRHRTIARPRACTPCRTIATTPACKMPITMWSESVLTLACSESLMFARTIDIGF